MADYKFRYFQAPREQNGKVAYVPIPLIDIVNAYFSSTGKKKKLLSQFKENYRTSEIGELN